HFGHSVGEASPPLVEEDQTRERREPPEKAGNGVVLPEHFDVGDPPRHDYQIARRVAHNLVGDVDGAAPGEACFRRHGDLSCQIIIRRWSPMFGRRTCCWAAVVARSFTRLPGLLEPGAKAGW